MVKNKIQLNWNEIIEYKKIEIKNSNLVILIL